MGGGLQFDHHNGNDPLKNNFHFHDQQNLFGRFFVKSRNYWVMVGFVLLEWPKYFGQNGFTKKNIVSKHFLLLFVR